MQLQEAGDDRARLYIPAELRDTLDLTDFEEVSVRLTCEHGRPVAFITPVADDDEADGVVRSLTVKSNGQVQLDFPRQVAVAAGLLNSELALVERDGYLVLGPEE
jgi:bifunctional DNA-binding transcriptional regulator/antitoxin component of YhaV-PrlF toxin-antitoxin module